LTLKSLNNEFASLSEDPKQDGFRLSHKASASNRFAKFQHAPHSGNGNNSR